MPSQKMHIFSKLDVTPHTAPKGFKQTKIVFSGAKNVILHRRISRWLELNICNNNMLYATAYHLQSKQPL